MRIKKWAKHIIKKFGRKHALFFTDSYLSGCPCIALGRHCKDCEYKRCENGIIHECKKAEKYFVQIFDQYGKGEEVKQKIIKMLKNDRRK